MKIVFFIFLEILRGLSVLGPHSHVVALACSSLPHARVLFSWPTALARTFTSSTGPIDVSVCGMSLVQNHRLAFEGLHKDYFDLILHFIKQYAFFCFINLLMYIKQSCCFSVPAQSFNHLVCVFQTFLCLYKYVCLLCNAGKQPPHLTPAPKTKNKKS